MAIQVLKCKICGGDVETNSDMTLGVCQYCGSMITLPRITEERRTEAFNRGNYYRRIGEFDNALSVYEKIISEDPNDAEAHWCAAISRFGIEYVEDPTTMEYIPTCHRVSYESFLEDIDYLKAVELSEGATKRQYMKDAAKISDVQNSILAKSQVEDPFDIFICYKESDDMGGRTRDSVIAQEIYYRLVEAGYKTFFARITLEDKVGTEYEPYIFSALNSSKVMIVIGTSKANLEAVWVKNEWSRYIVLMKKDSNKVLLPCYMNMNPYDMPVELASLQAYDINAMGFMQDLLRGMSKILNPNQIVTRVVGDSGNPADNFIKRGMLAVEAREWKRAENYFEQALNADPESSRAYLGKILVDKKVGNISELLKTSGSLKTSEDYSRALRFANLEFRNELHEYEKTIQKRLTIEKKRRKKRTKAILIVIASIILVIGIISGSVFGYNSIIIPRKNYKAARALCESGDYIGALSAFEVLGSYKDSEDWIEKCKIGIYGEQWYDFIKTCDIGKHVLFGNCLSEATTLNDNQMTTGEDNKSGLSPIDWTVIKKEDGRALIISTKIIYFTQVAGGSKGADAINEQLNKSFVKSAFTKEELSRIDICNEPGKNRNMEYMFIPDIEEITNISNDIRKTTETEYVSDYTRRYAQDNHRHMTNSYILYPSDSDLIFVSYVDEEGNINTGKTIESSYTIGIRPAMWIKTDLSNISNIADGKDSQFYMEQLSNATEGDCIKYGCYTQDNISGQSQEEQNSSIQELEWIVLEKNDNRLLVVSKYIIDCYHFDERNKGTAWDKSELRQWMNNELYNSAFDEEEKQFIACTKNKDNRGKETEDYLFALSSDEVQKYLDSNELRQCEPTEYASKKDNFGLYWLRSVTLDGTAALAVNGSNGTIFQNEPGSGVIGVRPAMWLEVVNK